MYLLKIYQVSSPQSSLFFPMDISNALIPLLANFTNKTRLYMLKIINAKIIARFDNWMNAINPPIELGDDISIVLLLFVE